MQRTDFRRPTFKRRQPSTTVAGWFNFSPLNLPGVVGWWDASDLDSFTFSSGTSVSEWRDKSGNANHFVQGTALNQPSASGLQNGMTTLVFDGSNDRLDTASFTLSQPLSFVFAIDYAGEDSRSIVSSVGGSLQTYASVGAVQMRMFAGTEQIVSSTGTIGVNVFGFRFDGASSKGWKNQAGSATFNPGSSGTTTGLRIAERNLVNVFNGEIFEIIATSNAITDANYEQMRYYLTSKWGI